MRTPAFWLDNNSISDALLPAACLYRSISRRRYNAVTSVRLPVPVICVGNVVAGGAGKTPTALAIASMMKQSGLLVHFLTRGYGGRLVGPVKVDTATHTAADVGDEALLLAGVLPTWVSRNRQEGGRAAVAAGAEFIIMDDGFQNPGLHKDVSFLVMDGSYGVGNGRIIPSGPLREPLPDALARASAVILVGEDRTGILRSISPYTPVIHASLRPAVSVQELGSRPLLAFAGIANPAKFRRTLDDMGCNVAHLVAFADHHPFTRRELEKLHRQAAAKGCQLVTTAKDYVRIPEALRGGILQVPVEIVFDEPEAVWRTVFP